MSCSAMFNRDTSVCEAALGPVHLGFQPESGTQLPPNVVAAGKGALEELLRKIGLEQLTTGHTMA